MDRGVFRSTRFGGKVPDGRAEMRTPPRASRTLGAFAVAGVITGFSLSATLAKQAQTSGVLIAFWRLAIAAVLWNVYLWGTRRRVTIRDVRQAALPATPGPGRGSAPVGGSGREL